jgi:class 3 adenylate cyclase
VVWVEAFMARLRYRNFSSFSGKSWLVLILLGIGPLLTSVYLFTTAEIDSFKVIVFSMFVLSYIIIGFALLRHASDQLVKLARETEDIKAGLKEGPVIIKADKEISDIADNFNAVLRDLDDAKKNVKEQSVKLMAYARDLTQSYEKSKNEERLRNRLSRYVGEHVVEKLINSKKEMFFENERKEVTVLFADIRSFTTIAESMAAEDVVSMLNNFFSIMGKIIFEHNGILDKFIGDQIMAIFGLIASESPAPSDAIKAALEMQNAAEALINKKQTQNTQGFEIGIGINTGTAIVGNIGFESRIDYTAIGDSVNIAARLQQLAKGGEIIIGELTHSQTLSSFPTQLRDEIFLKNMAHPIQCYNILRESLDQTESPLLLFAE